MAKVGFIHAPTNSIWVREYGPWFIFENDQLAIVDHIYNRPRPLDDVIPEVIGTQWSLDVYGGRRREQPDCGNDCKAGLPMASACHEFRRRRPS